MALLDNCKMLRYLLFYKGDQENGSDIFNCGLKAWVDNFIGCCRPRRCLLAIFLTKRIANRRSGIQNVELVLLCVWMKYKNVVMFYFIVVRIRYCVFV